ncbi:MAG: phytoene desaturase family protein, partial [Clostridium sp.]
KYSGDFYIPENGMDQILDILKNVIYKNSGEIITKSRVEKIIIDNKEVKGVSVNGNFIEADYVISGIDIWKTYKSLIGEKHVEKSFIDKLDKKWQASNSSYGLWIGLDCTLDEIGLNGECLYYYPDSDNITESKEALSQENGKIIDDPPIMINSNFSMHTECTPKGKSQLTIGFITSYSTEKNWELENGVRGEKYNQKKKEVQEKVFKVLEKKIPNIREHIEVIVDATPVTYERYSGNRRGAYTGYRKRAEYIFDKSRHKNESEINGLYFSSHWVAMQGGVLYTFLQGFNTANLILKNDENNDIYSDNNLIESQDLAI